MTTEPDQPPNRMDASDRRMDSSDRRMDSSDRRMDESDRAQEADRARLTDQMERGDDVLRAFLEVLEDQPLAFGILTHKGYRDLKDQFDRHAKRTRQLAQLVIIGMLAGLATILYSFYTDYQGRKVQVTAAREGCERDKADRKASVILNENILIAFEDSDKNRFTKPPTKERRRALKRIDRTTEGLDDRSKINCNERYPKASLVP
jgi:hypothetical protein